MTTPTTAEVLAYDFATLAREVAQDIFPIHDILRLHQLDEEQWAQIQEHPTFVRMLREMQITWNSAHSTEDRIKAKAQTAIEATVEVYFRDIFDNSIPLAQRVEAGKFLARLGGIGERGAADGSDRFTITINMGAVSKSVDVQPMKTIEHE